MADDAVSQKYHIDIILCIDCTGSMASVIDRAKGMARQFDTDLLSFMDHVKKDLHRMRVKVIGFRDVYDKEDKASGLAAFEESPFFLLRDAKAGNEDEKKAFESFLIGLRANGGGDEPESALEAISMAMKSDWDKGGDKRRHVIVVWTDAPAHRLERRETDPPLQPPPDGRTPASFTALDEWWHGNVMETSAQRMVIFAPEHTTRGDIAYPWTELFDNWERVFWHKSRAGSGLSDMGYTDIIARVAKSIE